MKALAFNCSPRMDKGITAKILGPFLEGMKEAGVDVELLYTKKLEINPCKGDLSCWVKNPGECIQNDDMRTVLPKLEQADAWVFATPVYVDGISGPMKNLLDRMVALVKPLFELRDGHCRHPLREEVKSGKVVLVSSCGFWEIDNFDPLVMHIKAACKNMSREFAGALLRPHGPVIRPMMGDGIPLDDIFEAAKEAGRQLVVDGEMREETLGTVSRTLLPLDDYVRMINEGFRKALGKSED